MTDMVPTTLTVTLLVSSDGRATRGPSLLLKRDNFTSEDQDFPGGPESACLCRGHGFNPWSRKIPHAAGQLSPRVVTTEPAHLELVPCKRSHRNEKPTHCNEGGAPARHN